MRTKKYAAIVILVTIVTIAIGFLLWNSEEQQALGPGYSHTPGEGWCRGRDDAPVTIDAFIDFECHTCVDKERLVTQALDIYPQEITLIYHHYPSSDFSYKLTEGLEAAGEQGKFWQMHDRFLEDVPHDISELQAVAEGLGLDMQKFNEALDSGKFAETVQLAKQEAISRGVEQVSLFINGKEYKKYPGTLVDLCHEIDEELERLAANGSN